jgi:hypothetical protein
MCACTHAHTLSVEIGQKTLTYKPLVTILSCKSTDSVAQFSTKKNVQ